jgi:hypothetical protein
VKITLAKSIILDRDAVFMILKDHFKEKGYDVANMDSECQDDSILSVTLNLVHEKVTYEQNL